MTRLAALVALVVGVTAAAPAARADDEAAKREARALIREGNLLLDKHDAAGALSLFEAAYAKFPSGKILVNIGSAERELGHDAAAANAYARYLAAGDDDAARTKQIAKLLAELDRKLGKVELTITPADAEVQLADGGWARADALTAWRASPGSLRVRARKAGFVDGEASAVIKKGATAALTLTLAAVPDAPPPDVVPPPPSDDLVAPRPTPADDALVHFGVAGKVVVDGKGRGAAGVVGAVLGVGPMLSVDVAAIVGPTFGAYGGLRLGITARRLRPVLGAGVPVFFDGGTRFGARATGGAEWRVSPRLRMSLEVGAEYMFTRAGDIDRWLFAPALSAEARL